MYLNGLHMHQTNTIALVQSYIHHLLLLPQHKLQLANEELDGVVRELLHQLRHQLLERQNAQQRQLSGFNKEEEDI